MNIKTYLHKERFTLESGNVLPEVEIAYSTYGTLNTKGDNVIWVCHALTANSEVAEWWPHTVEKDKFLDPSRYFIVCANILGSHYGTTGPLSVNPITETKYYKTFPRFTVRDIVECHIILAKALGIKKAEMLVGGSIGGFQVLEWLVMQPYFAKRGVLIATSAKAEPWVIAFNESQRMAIEADHTFNDKSDNAAEKGLSAARSIAMLSYRSSTGYNKTQSESIDEPNKIDNFRASSYQNYQGAKLASRFNVFSYYRLTQLVDSHNIGRGRGGIKAALETIKARCAIIAVSSDILYPIEGHLTMHKHIKNSSLHIIESEFGHDGFLIEHESLGKIITTIENEQN